MKNFLILLSIFIINSSFGQKSDPAAKVILDAVTEKFKTYKTLTADFSVKIENNAGKLVGQKSGVVQLKGNKFKVKMANQEIFCDGTKVVIYDKPDNTATINKYDPKSNTISPQKIFTSFYDKDFLYKLNPDTKINGKAVSEIELTPTDKSKSFFKVILHVDKATSTIVSTKIFEKTGSRMTYSSSKLVPNANIADAIFNFDASKYPGVEVEDAR